MMRIMNEEMGTTYNLGVVTRRYCGTCELKPETVKARREAEDARRAAEIAAGNNEPLPSILYPRIKADYMWNQDFIQYGSAVVNWTFEYGAVVWLYNDNSDEISYAYMGFSNGSVD
jgi:hypothetical protein